MEAKDHKAIAEIIERNRPSTSMAGMFLKPVIDALADYMQAENAKEKAVCQPDCILHRFDRAAWIATCYGETAHQDNATPGLALERSEGRT